MSIQRPLPPGAWCVDRGDPDFPPALADDPRPPERIHGLGELDLLAKGRPRVGMVGARRCTSYGRDVARSFGRELAAAGVSVVSGLALGIDGAAHEGALQAADGAPPIGVVASGLDVVYPRQHLRLWDSVGELGCLITEADFGTKPEHWRFPERNRIIAALSDIVLVVEAHPTSGTRHTVDAAIERGVPVMAVPGPVGSKASEGSNQLLREGCAPACELDDVLTALGLERCSGAPFVDIRRRPDACDEGILAAVDWAPTSLEKLMRRTTLGPGEITAALYRLLSKGWVRCTDGWWERIAAPGAP
ncbi:MAG TPA: DNA-processing protein DprA [Acidimicrobiales bacterium]|nr:DNA-processing protein DprA [Acidimicrobiales bacterium]